MAWCGGVPRLCSCIGMYIGVLALVQCAQASVEIRSSSADNLVLHYLWAAPLMVTRPVFDDAHGFNEALTRVTVDTYEAWKAQLYPEEHREWLRYQVRDFADPEDMSSVVYVGDAHVQASSLGKGETEGGAQRATHVRLLNDAFFDWQSAQYQLYLHGEGEGEGEGESAGGVEAVHPLFRAMFESPPWRLLQEVVRHHCAQFFKMIGKDAAYIRQHLLRDVHMWATVQKAGGYHLSHTHGDSDLSGVYYSQVPAGSGNLFFEDTRGGGIEPFDNVLEHTPRAGDLLLFASWMKHSVAPSVNTDDHRVAFSFNLKGSWMATAGVSTRSAREPLPVVYSLASTVDSTTGAGGRLESSASHQQQVAEGHLKPLGQQGPRHPVRVIETQEIFPSPLGVRAAATMHEGTASAEPKPVLFRGACSSWPAARRWSDNYLAAAVGGESVTVEVLKKENRHVPPVAMSISQFLRLYNASDPLYLIYDLTPPLLQDLHLPESFATAVKDLHRPILWMSSGGTQSVLHRDDVDNINCVLAGSKDWVIFDKVYTSKMYEVSEPTAHSPVDVTSVDLLQFPDFAGLPSLSVTVEAGDCLFLPDGWFHQVNSRGRNVAVNIWFKGFTASTSGASLGECEQSVCQHPASAASETVRRLDDPIWRYTESDY